MSLGSDINVKEYLSNFKSIKYTDYLDKLRLYQERKAVILLKGRTSNKYYKETVMGYELQYNKISIKLIKPQYHNVLEHILKLRKEREELIPEYRDLQYNILNEFETEQDYKKYDKVIKKLKIIDESIANLMEYHIKVNSFQYINKEEDRHKIQQLLQKADDIRKQVSLMNDNLSKNKALIEYFNILKEIEEIYKSASDVERIDFYISKLPEIIEYNVPIEEDNIKPIAKKQKKNMDEDEKNEARRSKLKLKIKEKLQEKTSDELQEMVSQTLKKAKDRIVESNSSNSN